jgi:hypothetical protein
VVIYPAIGLAMYEDQDETIGLQNVRESISRAAGSRSQGQQDTGCSQKVSKNKSSKLRVELFIYTLSHARD